MAWSPYCCQPAIDGKAVSQALDIIRVKVANLHVECLERRVGLEGLTKDLTTALDVVVTDTAKAQSHSSVRHS